MTGVSTSNLDEVAAAGDAKFTVNKPKRQPKTTVSVQFDAERPDLDLVRRALRRPSMSAGQIGQHTLEYFIEQEGLR